MCQLIVWLAHLPAKAPGEWHFQVVRSWAKVFHLLASLLDAVQVDSGSTKSTQRVGSCRLVKHNCHNCTINGFYCPAGDTKSL
jgi:hypothetical protein